jgi:predicted GNAT superfamily acetyltransferase
MSIAIRPIQTINEYRAAEQLQRAVWGLDEVEIVPDQVLLTAQRNGGLVLGAFDTSAKGNGRLVGLVFGFVGLTAEGKVKHCSHIAAVLPTYQNQNVGYRMKLAQREHVLAQGLDLVTWTFDPLESRNGYLNFHKLGVTCRTYLRDLYGGMRDALNAGLPSDRFQVDWHIASQRVTSLLRGEQAGSTLAALEASGVPVLNPPQPGDPPRPPETTQPLEGDLALVRIPAHFQAMKSADMGLAHAWRAHTRELFEAAFAAGYSAVDLLFEGGRSCYLLEKRKNSHPS